MKVEWDTFEELAYAVVDGKMICIDKEDLPKLEKHRIYINTVCIS